MTFGEKLTGLRKREGLSQEALAEQLGVSRQAVSRWEQGAALPDAAKLLPCARLFSVDVEWLLDEDQGSGDKVDSRSVPASKNRDVAWIVGGSLLLGLALLGLTIVATIGTAFSVNVEALTKNNELKSYSGLAGFLKYYDLYWVVAVLVLMAGVGVGMIVAGFRTFGETRGSAKGAASGFAGGLFSIVHSPVGMERLLSVFMGVNPRAGSKHTLDDLDSAAG